MIPTVAPTPTYKVPVVVIPETFRLSSSVCPRTSSAASGFVVPMPTLLSLTTMELSINPAVAIPFVMSEAVI